MIAAQKFSQRGWHKFPFDDRLLNWIISVEGAVEKAVCAPENQIWYRCNRTWFVGVNSLPNTPEGGVGTGPPLKCKATDFIVTQLAPAISGLDRGQVSICYPGYPGFSGDESEARYRFRLLRDAAHIDGLISQGPECRRFLKEAHAYILGIPLDDLSDNEAPPVVWESSHLIARQAFGKIFRKRPESEIESVDLTDSYQEMRQKIFKNCPRKIIGAKRGECYLFHRHLLHGIAPWSNSAAGQNARRRIIYFRPLLSNPVDWL